MCVLQSGRLGGLRSNILLSTSAHYEQIWQNTTMSIQRQRRKQIKQKHTKVNRRENTDNKVKNIFENALKSKYIYITIIYKSLSQIYFVYNFTIIT